MVDQKSVRKTLKVIISDTFSWLSNTKIKGKDWFEEDLQIDDDELGDLKNPIQDFFQIEIKKREIRSCIDVNDLAEVICKKIETLLSPSIEQQVSEQFFVALFSLGAKIAKADGPIAKVEVDAMEHFMRNILELNAEERNIAINIWGRAKESNKPFHDYAHEFMACNPPRDKVLALFELLFYIAAADKKLDPIEAALIKQAQHVFCLPMEEFDRLKTVYFIDVSKYYAILGCTPNDSMETIRNQYRKLLVEYHPDKLGSKSIPPDMIEFAENRTKELIAAYEAIVREKGYVS